MHSVSDAIADAALAVMLALLAWLDSHPTPVCPLALIFGAIIEGCGAATGTLQKFRNY
jgi:hypothetical protein